MAVISLEWSSVLTCPSATPLAVAHALTIWMGDLPFALSAELRTVLPSIATTCPSAASQTRFVHSMKRSWKFRASMMEKTRPKVSWDGIPLGSSRKVSNQSSLAFPKVSISTQLSAPAMTAQMATAMMSPSLALSGTLHSRVVDAGEVVYDGYGYGLRLFHCGVSCRGVCRNSSACPAFYLDAIALQRERGSVDCYLYLISGGELGCDPLDSRFRGNDGG